MKAKFTFLFVLFLLATSIYAQVVAPNKSSKLTGGFLKNRLERTETSTEHSPFQRKMGVQKQAVHLKSAQAIKQRLDSYTGQEWDELTGQWIPDEKYEFTYDAHLNLVQSLGYEWYENTNELVYNWREEYTYDVNDNLTQTVYLSLDKTTNQFFVREKYTYNYNTGGNITQEMNYEWDEMTNQLLENFKIDYTYDVSGNLIQVVKSYVDETTNQPTTFKSEYIYNVSGKETRNQQSYWDKTTNQWKLSNKYEFTYDSNGNVTLSLQSSWDGFSQWNAVTKDEYSYDANGNLILSLYSSINNGEWKPIYKDVYTFDDKGNNTQTIYYGNWDVSTNQWKDVWKSEYTLDNNYTINDLILPFDMVEDEEGFFTHMITEIKEYEWNIYTKEWILDYKTSLTYSAQNVTSIKSLDAELSKVYPNPFSESVSFSIPGSYSQITFELFDLQGLKLFEKAIGSNEKINMDGVRSGMYLYRLSIDGNIQNGKLIKE